MEIAVDHLSFSYGKTPVLHDICLAPFRAGEIVGLIGPNAAGKSTFFKCLAGLQSGQGDVRLDGRSIRQLNASELSRRIAYMPQDNLSTATMTVFEAVLLARQFNASWRVSEDDLNAVQAMLWELGIDHLALRHLNELSGGQRQMVSIGQALVRNPEAIILDEPTNNLDLQHQLELLDLVRHVTEERQLISIVALHDLNLAARFTDRIILFGNGRVEAAGPAEEVITEVMLHDTYGVHATIAHDVFGVPMVTPLASVRGRRKPLANAQQKGSSPE